MFRSIAAMHNLRFTNAQIGVTWPPKNLPTDVFRKSMIQISAGAQTDPFSDAALTPEFHTVIQSLLLNMERVLALLHVPQEVFNLSQRLEKLAQAAARDEAGGPDVPPHLHDAVVRNYEQRSEVNERWRPQIGVDFENSISVPNFPQEIGRLVDVPWAGVARVGVVALLHAALIGTWTAFESFAKDLWIIAVDQSPKTLAMNVFRRSNVQQQPNITFSELAEHGFNVSGKMGRLLVEKNRANFQSFTGTKEAFFQAFRIPEDKKLRRSPLLEEIFATFSDDLKCLEEIRNLLAHQGGMVDPIFSEKIKKYSAALGNLPVNEPLQVDGEMVSKYLGVVAQITVSLLNFVAEWLARQPE
jgi:hypothetical protein